MTDVLVLGGVAPSVPALARGLEALAALGAEVDVLLLNLPAGGRVPQPHRSAGRLLPRRYTADVPPRRWSRAWLVEGVRFRLLLVRLRTTSASVRVAALAGRDAGARAAAERADVVVALDRWAVYAAWRLARRRDLPAFQGLPAAVDHLRLRPVRGRTS